MKGGTMVEFIDDNKIRIADKDIRTYLGQCDKKLKKYDEVVLSFGKSFAEKARTIANILGAIGIKVHKSNINDISGNIKFGHQETNIINNKSGKRENRIFYSIVLTKIDNLDTEDITDYEFKDIRDSVKSDEDEISNELKISDNVLDFYLGQCNLDFQSYDQLVLSSLAENIETIKYIVKVLNTLGIQIQDEYLDVRNKKIYFHYIEKEGVNLKTGRKERKTFYRLGLTKTPALYMYTKKETVQYID
jgi:hypothetical protein